MTGVIFPRRLVSAGMTIQVNAPATTALEVARNSLYASYPSTDGFLAFHGPTDLTGPYGLSYTQNHPVTGVLCDPTEDGGTRSDPSESHTAIDWAAKGVYDTQSKRVMWASCGAGNRNNGDYVFNTMPFYDETQNRWTVSRGFRGANESTSAQPIVHMYDGNAIDIARRRFYRKKLDSREIMVYNLDTNAWLNNVTYTGGEPPGYGGDCGMDVIPSTGKLWIRGYDTNEYLAVWEVDPQNSGGPVRWVVPGVSSGSPLGNYVQNSVCCHNPRAFGGAGGVFVGGGNGAIIRVDTETVTNSSATLPPVYGNFLWAHHAHLCRDPVGDGWLYASQNGYMYRLTSAGVWSQRKQLPGVFGSSGWGTVQSNSMVMVPIDHLGVIWIIVNATSGTPRAWLYKP